MQCVLNSMESSSEASGGRLAKRLFSPSPHKEQITTRRVGSPQKASSVSPRVPLRGQTSSGGGLRGSFGLSCVGTLLLVLLCLVAIVATTELNYKWIERTDFSYQGV